MNYKTRHAWKNMVLTADRASCFSTKLELILYYLEYSNKHGFVEPAELFSYITYSMVDLIFCVLLICYVF